MIKKNQLRIMVDPFSEESEVFDIIFTNRNKEYGAYALRKDYTKNLSLSSWGVILGFILVLSIFLISTLISSKEPEDIKPKKVVQVFQLSEPPSIVETRTERVQAPVVRKPFVAPKVMKDEKVKKEMEFKPPEHGSSNPDPDQTIELKEEVKKAPPPKPQVPQVYFVAVDFMPEPLGGFEGIQSKVVYPEAAKQAGIEGRVFVKAYIDENGTVTRTELVKGIGYGCDEAAERAVMRTRFRPGKQKGSFVKVQMSVQVTFKL